MEVAIHSAESQPVEFRLQIAVELGAASDPVAPHPGGGARGTRLVQQFVESAHVHHILEKLEVHSKLEAVSLAFRRGWATD
jgi:hypothetical protein